MYLNKMTTFILSLGLFFSNNAIAESNNQLLMQASLTGDLTALKDSLDNGANINACDPEGITALHLAILVI